MPKIIQIEGCPSSKKRKRQMESYKFFLDSKTFSNTYVFVNKMRVYDCTEFKDKHVFEKYIMYIFNNKL